jgi:sec-independent protein translocase protein TatA
MPSIGPLELVIVLVIVLLIFGPKRLPGLGRQLGSGMREFKDGITGKNKGEVDEGSDTAARAFGDEPRTSAPKEPAAVPGAPEEPAPVAGEPPAPEAPRADS